MLKAPYQNNFRWFEGVVEDRNDPLELGLVRVRVFSLHSGKLSDIPTNDLQWMQVMHPTTSSANSGVSKTPKLLEGTHVIGFFRDGDSCQDGVVLGTIAGLPQEPRNTGIGFNDNRTNLTNTPVVPSNWEITSNGVNITNSTPTGYPKYLDEPDLSKATSSNRGQPNVYQIKNSSLISNATFKEPASPNKVKFPYNDVTETESGHLFELDDTPNYERIHLAHRSGSFLEYHPNGDVVQKTVSTDYRIIHATSNEYVAGNKNIIVDEGANVIINNKGGTSSLNITVNSGGDMVVNISGGNMIYNINGNMQYNITGGLEFNVEEGTSVNSNGDFSIKAPTISLN